MNDIQKERSLSVFEDELVYLEACLLADAETADVAVEVSDELVALEKTLQAEREFHRKEVLSRAQVKIKTRLAETFIRAVYAAGLFEVTQNRKDPRYQKLFKYDQSSVLRMNVKSQLEEALRMKGVLNLAIYEDGFRDSVNDILDKVIVELNAALGVRAALEEAHMHHRLAVEQAKDRVNKVRGRVYGELTILSQERKERQEKTWARSFFPETKATKKLSVEEVAKKNAAKAKRASEKAAVAAEIAADKSRKAAAKSQLEADKAALEAKSKITEQDEAKLRMKIRAQLEEDERLRIEAEERARLREEAIELKVREQVRLERERELGLNGGGDGAEA